MLRCVEITATVVGPMHGKSFHNLHWQKKLELSVDCFVCERTGRTTTLVWGAERGICSADEERGPHFAPVRISAFDYTIKAQELALRVVVDYWWAPFHDEKRDQPALPLVQEPWARLGLGYSCRQHEKSGERSIQTNLVRPSTLSCEHCGAVVATSRDVLGIRLLV